MEQIRKVRYQNLESSTISIFYILLSQVDLSPNPTEISVNRFWNWSDTEIATDPKALLIRRSRSAQDQVLGKASEMIPMLFETQVSLFSILLANDVS